jgi:hypothetical protein
LSCAIYMRGNSPVTMSWQPSEQGVPLDRFVSPVHPVHLVQPHCVVPASHRVVPASHPPPPPGPPSGCHGRMVIIKSLTTKFISKSLANAPHPNSIETLNQTRRFRRWRVGCHGQAPTCAREKCFNTRSEHCPRALI